MATPTCRRCGKPVAAYARFCGRCGQAYPAEGPPLPGSRGARTRVVCTTCTFHGPPLWPEKGSGAVEVALWLLLLVPGIIYSVWRRSNLRPTCSRCTSELVVWDDTPEAGRILQHRDGSTSAAPQPNSSGFVDELERLAALREKGALTEEEFAEQKRRLLEST